MFLCVPRVVVVTRLVLLCSLREHLEQASPSAVAAHPGSHLGRTGSHAIEVPMFKVDTRRAVVQRRKLNFYFTRLREIGFEAPRRA